MVAGSALEFQFSAREGALVAPKIASRGSRQSAGNHCGEYPGCGAVSGLDEEAVLVVPLCTVRVVFRRFDLLGSLFGGLVDWLRPEVRKMSVPEDILGGLWRPQFAFARGRPVRVCGWATVAFSDWRLYGRAGWVPKGSSRSLAAWGGRLGPGEPVGSQKALAGRLRMGPKRL